MSNTDGIILYGMRNDNVLSLTALYYCACRESRSFDDATNKLPVESVSGRELNLFRHVDQGQRHRDEKRERVWNQRDLARANATTFTIEMW